MERKCIINAKDCFGLFTPTSSLNTSCRNPGCIEKRNKDYRTAKSKTFNQSMKKPKKASIMRPCIGIHCRGEKMFRSINGARICKGCAQSIGMIDY